jgi:hypothetical protein
LNFRCQCTQQKLQSIWAVLTFDPQHKKILAFSVKDRYQLNYFICIKDFNAETITSLKLNKFVFFLFLRLSASWKENDLPLCIYFWYQTDSGVPNTSIYSAVSLASPCYNYLWSIASTTMICWRCHRNSVNTESRLPISSDAKKRKRRNVIGIDMIRNNRIVYLSIGVNRALILLWFVCLLFIFNNYMFSIFYYLVLSSFLASILFVCYLLLLLLLLLSLCFLYLCIIWFCHLFVFCLFIHYFYYLSVFCNCLLFDFFIFLSPS